jgi:soluble lytic murein transglycosylase-like protein
MQIDDRSWPGFTGDRSRWTDPQQNISYGAGILGGYYRSLGESWPPAICAYNAGPTRVNRYIIMRPTATVAELDFLTTGHNYVSDVLRRWALLEGDDTFGDVEGGWS